MAEMILRPNSIEQTLPLAKYLSDMADGDPATVGTLSAGSGESAGCRAKGFGKAVDPTWWDDVWLRVPMGWSGPAGDSPEGVRCFVRAGESDDWQLAASQSYGTGSDYTFSVPLDVVLSGLNTDGLQVELIYDQANGDPPLPEES